GRLGECGAHPRSDDERLVVFERLPEGLQTAAPNLGHLVQKQSAVVRPADSAWSGEGASSAQAGLAHGVMGRSERRGTHDAFVLIQEARHAVQSSCFESFLFTERW